ncbi:MULTISPECIES: ATP-binding protein [unclassified Halomonas]|uniref:ATP-binding protein n=1 Tax=unclassified Halomonas TaxID=2609666 RepID=UPI00207675A7|nr:MULTISPECIES: ATP-binding protein [unclassified Halomonas]
MPQPLTTTPQVRGQLASMLAGTATTKPDHCRIHGAFANTQMPNGQWAGCPQCVMEDVKGVSQAEVNHANDAGSRRRLEKLREESLIPRRFVDKSLDGFHARDRDQAYVLNVCRAYVSKFDERLAQGGGLIFTGSVGTGKSHLAYAIGNALLAGGRVVMGIDVYELIDLIKERAFSKEKGASEREAIRAFVSGLDLLILDEVGAQLGTEWERLMLFKIINERYKQMLPTILISNLEREQLDDYLGKRIIDRMQEGGGTTLKLDWGSYRAQRGAA